MKKCDHTIGIWFYYDDSDFVKLSKINVDSEELCRHGGTYIKCEFYDGCPDLGIEGIGGKPDSCKQCDSNVYDRICWFNYCPDCGECLC